MHFWSQSYKVNFVLKQNKLVFDGALRHLRSCLQSNQNLSNAQSNNLVLFRD